MVNRKKHTFYSLINTQMLRTPTKHTYTHDSTLVNIDSHGTISVGLCRRAIWMPFANGNSYKSLCIKGERWNGSLSEWQQLHSEHLLIVNPSLSLSSSVSATLSFSPFRCRCADAHRNMHVLFECRMHIILTNVLKCWKRHSQRPNGSRSLRANLMMTNRNILCVASLSISSVEWNEPIRFLSFENPIFGF